MKILLFNPFQKYSEKQLLVSGIIATIIGSYLGYFFHTRFDGVVDVHFRVAPSWLYVLSDNLIIIFCLSVLLLILAKYINIKTRVIDIITTVIIFRIPFYLLPFLNFNDVLKNTGEQMIMVRKAEDLNSLPHLNLTIMIIAGLVSLLFIVWAMALLYNGFKVASNSKEKIHIVLFVVAIVLSEIITSIILHSFNH